YKAIYPEKNPTYLLAAIMTDSMFRKGSVEMAERKAWQGGAPAYLYRIDWETPVWDGKLKAPHGLDLALMFDNTDRAPGLVGTGPVPKKIAARMAQAWVNFARTGDPDQNDLPWPAYTAERPVTMLFDEDSRAVT